MNYYTFYNNKNDEIEAFGTAKHCAEMMNTTENCIYSLINKARKGKQKKWTIVIEELKNEEIYQ